jgi:enoyl-CoA hydratase/carnithine racemase
MAQHQDWSRALPDCVSVATEDEVGIITLNRPQKRNALSSELVQGLTTAFATLPEGVKAIVLRGEGSHFCGGLDLGGLRESSIAECFAMSKIGQRLNDSIQFASVPVVSVLQGAVIGGGLEIAAASHIRVAEPSAYFALPEGMRGIFVGSGGSVRLPRLIGTQNVMDMMLTGRVIAAAEAHDRLGLVQYLTAEGEGLAKGIALAKRAAQNAPMANYAMLHALPRIAEQSPSEGLFTETLMVALAQDDEEAKRRLREFLDEKKNKVLRT